MAKGLAVLIAACMVAVQFAPGALAAGPFHRIGFLDPALHIDSDGVRYAYTLTGPGHL